MNMLGKDVSLYKSIDNFISNLFVSEVYLRESQGQQGLGRVCLGVFPRVYLHLLYLVVFYIEHSQGFTCYED